MAGYTDLYIRTFYLSVCLNPEARLSMIDKPEMSTSNFDSVAAKNRSRRRSGSLTFGRKCHVAFHFLLFLFAIILLHDLKLLTLTH